MSDVNTSEELVQNAVILCNGILGMLSDSLREMQYKYRNVGNGWSDSKYQQLGDIVSECGSSIKRVLQELSRCCVALDKIALSVMEYGSINISGTLSGTEVNSSVIANINNSLSTSSILNSDESTVFYGTMSDGTVVALTNVSMERLTYTKRGAEEREVLRREFNNRIRRQFLNELGNMDDAYLLNLGLLTADINRIRAGRVPRGYHVHHKIPLDDSGDNDFDNLILIRHRPYHIILTNYQDEVSGDLNSGESLEIAWPVPDGMIYLGR